MERVRLPEKARVTMKQVLTRKHNRISRRTVQTNRARLLEAAAEKPNRWVQTHRLQEGATGKGQLFVISSLQIFQSGDTMDFCPHSVGVFGMLREKE